MKKKLCVILFTLLAIGLASCSAPTATMTPSIADTATPTPVRFTDPVLEAMIRETMGKPEGDITVAEAELVTRLNLSNELQRHISEETQIKDISGLENFTNLESLDLSFHDITDISALAGLTKLTSLSLGGNPITDISPLTGLTNLKVLILSNCAAQDYSPLAKLVNLQYLKLDNSTIGDASPLASLSGLQQLYLANSPVDDYSSLAKIYPNLKEKDFTIPSTLEELGFYMNDQRNMAKFGNDVLDVIINHSEWGAPTDGRDADSIFLNLLLTSGYTLKAGYSPDQKSYGFAIVKDGSTPMIYSYDTINGEFSFESGDRQGSEQAVRAAMDVMEGKDVLLTPVRVFNDTIQKTFKMKADVLYALPFEPPTLKNLGFFPDEQNAVCLYEQRGERDYNIEIHRPEWGTKEYDVRFFTPLSTDYRIVITYQFANNKFEVGGDDNFGGGARFEYDVDTNQFVDVWSSDNAITVKDYFIKAYNDPAITDVYAHSIELMEQYFRDRFGMTFEELYALPTCE